MTIGVVVYFLLVIVTADQILPRWAGCRFAAGGLEQGLVPLPADLKGWARPVEDCVSFAEVDITCCKIGDLRGWWL